MQRELKILVLEDCDTDRELLKRELVKGGLKFEARFSDTGEGFIRNLEDFKPNLVISDYALPTYDGLSALREVRRRRPELPFIFVSGTMGEDRAVEALKEGATDYFLKGATKRLCQAVERAVREAEEREEKKRLEEQLFQSQKMEAIGQLAGGVAHDFNNLLTAILGYSEMILEESKEDDPNRRHATEILRAGEKAKELTRQLLAFSRKQMITPKVIDLNAVVRGVEGLLQRLLPESVRLAAKLSQELGRTRADPGQIEQVIMNLAVNARDAMPEGGELTIETADVELDEEYARRDGSVSSGPYVTLSVSDTGTGIEEGVMPHLFEPFFTTKPKGEGTGLGLATVYGVVRQSNGSIEVSSRVGSGTTFRIHLPRVSDPVEAAKPITESKGMPQGMETILVVEDDGQVRAFVGQILRRCGYTVLEAPNGAEALKIVDAQAEPPHLIVTDVVMPSMGGGDLVNNLQSKIPNLRVLFLSGYTMGAVLKHGAQSEGIEFLQKPFTASQLANRVRQILNRSEN